MDVTSITAATDSTSGKNLFAYCDNNPVVRQDPSGRFWDTFLDWIGVGSSGKQLIEEPSLENAGMFFVDLGAALLPFVPSPSVAKMGIKAVGAIDDINDNRKIIKGVSKADNIIKYSNLDEGVNFSNKALEHMGESGR